MVRGGHIDLTVLGALQVDEEGNLANWMIPGQDGEGHGRRDGPRRRRQAGHRRDGAHDEGRRPQDPERCTLPFTGLKVVNLIVTELAVIEVTPAGPACCAEIAADTTVDAGAGGDRRAARSSPDKVGTFE